VISFVSTSTPVIQITQIGEQGMSLKDKAYEIIKDRIINCVYPPGAVLNERQKRRDRGQPHAFPRGHQRLAAGRPCGDAAP
jgi:hypothetical protein